MSLKYKLDNLNDVPEALHNLYTEQNGKFILQLEGAVPKERLDEFRANNISLKEKIDALTAQYDGIDPAQYKTLLAQQADLKSKKQMDAGEFDKELEERTKAMKADHDSVLKKLTDQLTTNTTQLERLLIDNALQAEAVKSGIRPTAVDDVLNRGRARYKVKDGQAVPVDAEGRTIYGKDGTTPQSMGEWLADLAPLAPHLFEPSNGGGATNNTKGAPNAAKSIKRSDYEKSTPTQKAEIIKSGAALID